MRTLHILYPMIVLAFWTIAILLIVLPLARGRAVASGKVTIDDFKYGESAQLPPNASLPNRNLINLLEMPVLFYVVCLLLFVTGGGSYLGSVVAWVYVGLRIAHSLVHLTYNNVVHRTFVFGASNLALLTLWVLAALHLVSAGGAA